jgi:predicted acylesterase/phospholipase RssA
MSEDDRRLALNPSQVRFLALEGGGGKGIAFLGAIEALHALRRLPQDRPLDLWGYAGASAGAITSLLLAMNYTPMQIRDYLRDANFSSFFDPPFPRKRPAAGRPYETISGLSEGERNIRTMLSVSSLSLVPTALRAFGNSSGEALGLMSIIFGINFLDLVGARSSLRAKFEKEPYKGLLSYWKDYFAILPADMGLFSGEAARQEFDRLIREAIVARYPNIDLAEFSRRGMVTFRDFEGLFADPSQKRDRANPRLLVTGTNLSTGRTELFSAIHTPLFPVADAIRISMSLPFIYKPYVIARQPEGYPPCGTYVDGGLWNNLPFRELSANPSTTLALRLEVDIPSPVHSTSAMLAKAAKQGVFGTGESQVLRHYDSQIVTLDTRGLDLIDFNPPEEARETVRKRSWRSIYRAFGRQIPADYADAKDDAESRELLNQSATCVARSTLVDPV